MTLPAGCSSVIACKTGEFRKFQPLRCFARRLQQTLGLVQTALLHGETDA